MADQVVVIRCVHNPLATDDEPGIPIQPGEVDRHFELLDRVMAAYPARSRSPEHLDLFLCASRAHLAEFARLAPALRAWCNGLMPRVPTFQMLAVSLAERGKFEEAIAVCAAALEHRLDDGTKGGFAGRIERLRRKVDAPERGVIAQSREQRRVPGDE